MMAINRGSFGPPSRRVALNRQIETVDALRRWARSANPGDTCVYHEGLIGLDRREDPDLSERADLALLLAMTDWLIVSQPRPPSAGPGVFAYLATRTGRGWAPRHVMSGMIAPADWHALRAVFERDTRVSARRSIRIAMGVSDAAADQILAGLRRRNLVAQDGQRDSWVLTKAGMEAVA